MSEGNTNDGNTKGDELYVCTTPKFNAYAGWKVKASASCSSSVNISFASDLSLSVLGSYGATGLSLDTKRVIGWDLSYSVLSSKDVFNDIVWNQFRGYAISSRITVTEDFSIRAANINVSNFPLTETDSASATVSLMTMLANDLVTAVPNYCMAFGMPIYDQEHDTSDEQASSVIIVANSSCVADKTVSSQECNISSEVENPSVTDANHSDQEPSNTLDNQKEKTGTKNGNTGKTTTKINDVDTGDAVMDSRELSSDTVAVATAAATIGVPIAGAAAAALKYIGKKPEKTGIMFSSDDILDINVFPRTGSNGKFELSIGPETGRTTSVLAEFSQNGSKTMSFSANGKFLCKNANSDLSIENGIVSLKNKAARVSMDDKSWVATVGSGELRVESDKIVIKIGNSKCTVTPERISAFETDINNG